MLKRLQKIAQIVARAVQKVLVPVFLVVVYVIGFGLTSVFLRIFRRDLLAKTCSADNACWGDAVGYGVDREDSLRQS